jgi:hypothetical protein
VSPANPIPQSLPDPERGPRSRTYPAGRQPMKILARPLMPARSTASEFCNWNLCGEGAHSIARLRLQGLTTETSLRQVRCG